MDKIIVPDYSDITSKNIDYHCDILSNFPINEIYNNYKEYNPSLYNNLIDTWNKVMNQINIINTYASKIKKEGKTFKNNSKVKNHAVKITNKLRELIISFWKHYELFCKLFPALMKT